MCAVEAEHRRQGVGEFMVNSILSQLPSSDSLEATCLPKAMEMRYLLVKIGFKNTRQNPGNSIKTFIFANH